MSTAKKLNATELIGLGECSVVLRNPRVWNATNYVANRTYFENGLRSVGLGTTLAAANRLLNHPVNQFQGVIIQGVADTLEAMAKTVHDAMQHETAKLTLIASDYVPPAALTNLQGQLKDPLEPHQVAMYDDLITCLEAHLARPGIVMAWSLCYDLIRSWIFRDRERLAALARILDETICNDHDFFKLKEYGVLSGCERSQDATLQQFTQSHFRDLQNLLDVRNDFAHANFNRATMSEATAYVERIVRAITDPPFN